MNPTSCGIVSYDNKVSGILEMILSGNLGRHSAQNTCLPAGR